MKTKTFNGGLSWHFVHIQCNIINTYNSNILTTEPDLEIGILICLVLSNYRPNVSAVF